MHHYPHHIGDFNSATRHLNRLERGIYRDLIELYYDTEEPLIGDVKLICRKIIAVTEEEVTAVEQVLAEFFKSNNSRYHHRRCEKVIAGYHRQQKSKSKAGKASAKARADAKYMNASDKSDSTGVEQVLDSVEPLLQHNLTGVCNQEPRTKNQEPIKRVPKKKTPGGNIPPTLAEVQEYISERNSPINAQRFVDYYETNGWRVGKNAKMKNWQSAIRNWEARRKDNQPQKSNNDGTYIE
ncbi:MAG: YdaU family protein [Nitrosomonadaceae bacterium]